MREHLLAVRGNCDAEIDQAVLQFPIQADYCALFLGGRTLFATHGHLFSKEAPPPLKKGDILLSGHTHVPACEPGDIVFMNPGSLSIPKEDSPHSYMTLEDGLFAWKEIDGEIYREFAMD